MGRFYALIKNGVLMRFKKRYKKVWKGWFDPIVDGSKSADLRLGADEFEVGDVIVYQEWDQDKEEYTGRSIEKRVTDVRYTRHLPFWTEEQILTWGHVMISLGEVENPSAEKKP